MSNSPHDIDNQHDQAITPEYVRYIAEDLAKIKIQDDELSGFHKAFKDTVDLFKVFDAINTDHIDAIHRPARTLTQCRTDRVTATDMRKDIESSSPYFDSETHLFDVPQVIDDE